MSEYVNEYFTDIMEAVEHLEKSLLDFDETLSKNVDDPAQIHIIFRNAHNLKGTLALAKLENSQNLIHIIEDNFDQIRNGKASASTDLVDKSLKALDLISKSLSQGIENPDDFTELKKALEPDSEIVENIPILPFQLSQEEKDNALTACKGKSSFFIIEKLIKTSIDEESYSNLPIFKDVKEIGSLVGFRPPWKELNKKSEDDVIRILFSTEKSEEDLFFIIFDPIKPLNKDDICRSLAAAGKIDKEEHPSDTKIVKQRPLPENLKILLVEDDFITRTLQSKILSKFGQCDVAVNGREAITTFRNSLREKKRYDLILLDIMIPEIDGGGVLTKVRTLETKSGITGLDMVKVIMVSSINSIETIKNSFTEQSDAYIVKPFTEKKLIRELQRFNFKK